MSEMDFLLHEEGCETTLRQSCGVDYSLDYVISSSA
jgi:hypothetical protein